MRHKTEGQEGKQKITSKESSNVDNLLPTHETRHNSKICSNIIGGSWLLFGLQTLPVSTIMDRKSQAIQKQMERAWPVPHSTLRTWRVVMCLSLNLFSQYRNTSDVLPTQPSPNKTTLKEYVLLLPPAPPAAMVKKSFFSK